MTRAQTALFTDLWESEYRRTLAALEAIPDSLIDSVPFHGTMPLRRLALHIILLEEQFIRGVAAGELTAGGSRYDLPEARTTAALVEEYQRRHAGLRPVLAAMDDAALAKPVPFRLPNGTVMRMAPGLEFLFEALLHHQVHHRAQLLTFIRLSGQRIPGLYGPVREETPPNMV